MKRLLCVTLVLATAATVPAAAQTFGELFPLTNTRYRPAVGSPKLAANDREFILFWPADYRIRATRLGDGLPRGGHVIFDESRGFDVAWMGERFLAVSSRKVNPIEEQELVGQYPDANALLGNDEKKISQVAILRENGTVVRVIDVDAVKSAGRKPPIEPLPADGLALVASRINDEAPHHGTHHVMMTIARSTPIAPPAAPHVTARIEGNFISIDWSAPSGTINGYRIEYRVDDDSWNEIDEWFAPGTQHTSIRKPDFGARFAIRIRAFNDAGAGAYSATAVTGPGRRRAVR